MKYSALFLLICAVMMGCGKTDKYSPANYSQTIADDNIHPQIISYIFSAPPYTAMKDRFKPEHNAFYSSLVDKFPLKRYFIAEDGTHYFYLIRPSGKTGEQRGAAGHFKVDQNKKLVGFREEFVTPVLPDADLNGRVLFLFDEMVHGTLKEYLKMPAYVQWPNGVSSYDTTTYEWKFIPEKVN